MIVHIPEKTQKNCEVIISSRFEMQKPLPHLPETLWYSFPEKYESLLNTRADAFAAPTLLLAMHAGEDLDIRGEISPVLAENLQKYHDHFYTWWPEIFQKIKLDFKEISTPPLEKTSMVMTTFSGGVDSFYCLWENLAERQANTANQITHGIFISGIDLRLDDEMENLEVFKEYKNLFKGLGIELIMAATNSRHLTEFRVNWTQMFGASTISIAHLFSSRLRKFYFPSDVAVSWVDYKHGSSPLTDPLLSSEAVEIIHQGILPSRGGKIKELVKWPVTHHKLRVCADKIRMHNLNNCSRCHKCYRTMTWLELEDGLQHFSNFKGKMVFLDYLRWGLLTHLNKLVAIDIRNEAWKRKNYRMAVFTQLAVYLNANRKFAVESIKKLLGKNITYKFKRLIYKPESGEPK